MADAKLDLVPAGAAAAMGDTDRIPVAQGTVAVDNASADGQIKYGTLTQLWTWVLSKLSSASPQVTALNLGHASDTTFTRVSAGLVAVEGINLVRQGDNIAFPATQVPSADANTLDDYEEGTFTPAITIGGSAVGVTYSAQNGRYTKIGRQVNFLITMTLSSKGGLTGSVVITGLPFSCGLSNAACYGAIDAFGALTGSIPQWVLSTTTILARRLTQSSGGDGAIDGANLTDTSVFRLSGQYNV
jgi:hypothetical protein